MTKFILLNSTASRMVIALYFFLLVPDVVSAQSGRLIGNISFDSLVKRKVPRSVTWVNPDGKQEQMSFIEMAIPIDDNMKGLTQDFNDNNYGIQSPWLRPRMIVFHSMDLGNLRESLERSSFLHDRMPPDWGVLPKAGRLPNGSQFMVDQDGTIYCLAPPVGQNGQVSYERKDHRWYIKRHADGNPVAIGIENTTPYNQDMTDLTAVQIASNAKLARWLLWFEGGKIDHLNSHHQFDDVLFLNKMLHFYSLNYEGKLYRTTNRHDIGEARLAEITTAVNAAGYSLHSKFD